MIYYIIQIIAFQVFFLLVYDVFLRKETFFNWNRVYLLVTAILSVILPLIKVERFKEIVPQKYILLPEIILGQVDDNNPSTIINTTFIKSEVSLLEVLFWVGVALTTVVFFYKFINILKLIIKNPKHDKDNFVLVKLKNSNASFSFFKYVFLGERLKEDELKAIIKHEYIHVKQLHSIDLLFFELLRICFWFNPLVYMYQKRMAMLHEFIADSEAVKTINKSKYYQNLLSQVFQTKNISFINPFFKQSLIKKRIVMLQKSKSKQIKLLKYALLIPMILGMLAFTSGMEENYVLDKALKSTSVFSQENNLVISIRSVKYQIQKQGNVSSEEEKGLDLLLQIVKREELSSNLIRKVEKYMSQDSQTELEKKISTVFKGIQKKGALNKEEARELKVLLILTSENGFEDPFFADVIKYVDMPFSIIEEVPTFPGCENMSNIERKKCLPHNISLHVNRNFNTKLADSLDLRGKQRINVIFKINNEGNIVGVRARAPHPVLKAEAIRVIKTLPKMLPGKHKGRNINVPYSMPIIFQVKDKKK